MNEVDLSAPAVHLPGWLLAVIGALSSVVALWKMVPAATRAALELRYPRPVGLLRALSDLLPDLVGFLRTGRYQVVEGKPRSTIAVPRELTTSQRVRIEQAGGEVARVKVERVPPAPISAAPATVVVDVEAPPTVTDPDPSEAPTPRHGRKTPFRVE